MDGNHIPGDALGTQIASGGIGAILMVIGIVLFILMRQARQPAAAMIFAGGSVLSVIYGFSLLVRVTI